jgi:hypothetical protein
MSPSDSPVPPDTRPEVERSVEQQLREAVGFLDGILPQWLDDLGADEEQIAGVEVRAKFYRETLDAAQVLPPDTREWTLVTQIPDCPAIHHDLARVKRTEPESPLIRGGEQVVVVPKSALSAARQERDEALARVERVERSGILLASALDNEERDSRRLASLADAAEARAMSAESALTASRDREGQLEEALGELVSLHDVGYFPAPVGPGDVRYEALDAARAALAPSKTPEAGGER